MRNNSGDTTPVSHEGIIIGDYLIEGIVGSGSMAIVYRARQRKLGQLCAVKLMNNDPAAKDLFEHYISKEGQTLAQLEHPNIVRVYYAGRDAGHNYLVLEYADRGNLEKLIEERGGSLPVEETHGIITQVLKGLAYAHERGVVHRDVKPANILMHRDGRFLLSDFDLSTSGQDEANPRAQALPQDPEQTIVLGKKYAPILVGTIDYMSPEQRAGEPADARSDIFSVGVMCYRMMTGIKPSPGCGRPSTQVDGISDEWDEWILRCMDIRPDSRFQSAKEALEHLPDPKGHKKKSNTANMVIGALSIALILSFIVPYACSRSKSPSRASDQQATAIAQTTMQDDSTTEESHAEQPPAQITPEPVDSEAVLKSIISISEVSEREKPLVRSKANLSSIPLSDRLPRPAAMIDGKVGGLVILTQPDGADVDISPDTHLRSPVLLSELEPGDYDISFSAKGYHGETRTVTVKAGSYTELPLVSLKRQSGSLGIDSSPASLEWRIIRSPDDIPDEISKGKSPSSIEALPTGNYMIEFSLSGWAPSVESFEIKNGEQTKVTGILASGSLVVSSIPEGAEIIAANGKVIGTTPYAQTIVPTGDCKLTLRLREYKEAHVEGIVREGETLRLSCVMDRANGAVEGRDWTLPDHGIEMLWVNPGTFAMGSGKDDPNAIIRETPQHKVTLTQGFWLGRYEVTLGQWEAVMGYTPNFFRNGGPQLPVEFIDWDEAMEFCRRLNMQERREGRLPVGYEYTLPTEAQWEYACRAGSVELAVSELEALAWHQGNSDKKTHKIGSLPANQWGFSDMLGNVSEWCFDAYAPYSDADLTDPVRTEGGEPLCVMRGGSWDNTVVSCRPSYRFYSSAGARSEKVGFRLALAPVR